TTDRAPVGPHCAPRLPLVRLPDAAQNERPTLQPGVASIQVPDGRQWCRKWRAAPPKSRGLLPACRLVGSTQGANDAQTIRGSRGELEVHRKQPKQEEDDQERVRAGSPRDEPR